MSKLFRINCGFQTYDWGKHGQSSAVAQFASSSDKSVKIDANTPYAELWMGTHPSVPSVAIDSKKSLRELITANPDAFLSPEIVSRFGQELPFLFKVLSIEKVLSIQAHPDKTLAKQLHASDPKNYPDDNHKPEMAIAVTDFEGFCGFKPLQILATTLQTIPELNEIIGQELVDEFSQGISSTTPEEGSAEDIQNRKLLQKIFGKLMNTDEKIIGEKAQSLVERTKTQPELFTSIDSRLPQLIQTLNKQFPNDIGLFCGCLLLNHVQLNSGEAMFLQAKDPHAYISGDIIECMAASDNVVRAGFTPKFKDVDNLVSMLTYSYGDVEKQKMPKQPFPRSQGDAIKSVLYDPPISEFSVLQTVLSKSGDKQVIKGLNGPSIIITTGGKGTIAVKGEAGEKVDTGYVFFIAPDVEVELVSESEDFTSYRAFVEV
ncbi:Mannose-6-phosphate isomerase [Spathaspora sp. JA1]|nr:Mannose-6-phosphate isomerase [Spathaspora sp. JA1]